MSASSTLTTAVVGAGIAGLACARTLQAAGLAVTVFEKSRGPGGRMTSRRFDEATLDLGAQFFSVRDDSFRREVTRWLAAGLAAPWPWKLWHVDGQTWHYQHDGRERYCGQPRMSAITRHLAEGLALHAECRIDSLSRRENAWWLHDQHGECHGPFDRVVISAPSPQALALVADHDEALAEACRAVVQRSCWAGWACLETPLPDVPGVEHDWQAAQVAHGPLRFIARNQYKPGRAPQGETLTLLAHPDWSDQHLEDEPQIVACRLLEALVQALPPGTPPPRVSRLGAHRWRFAHPELPATGATAPHSDYRYAASGLALCGDAWRGPRIEDAWLSGHRLGLALVAPHAHPTAFGDSHDL